MFRENRRLRWLEVVGWLQLIIYENHCFLYSFLNYFAFKMEFADKPLLCLKFTCI